MLFDRDVVLCSRNFVISPKALLEELSLNAFSKIGLTMGFSVHDAKAQPPTLKDTKALVDSCATHCYVSGAFAMAHGFSFAALSVS